MTPLHLCLDMVKLRQPQFHAKLDRAIRTLVTVPDRSMLDSLSHEARIAMLVALDQVEDLFFDLARLSSEQAFKISRRIGQDLLPGQVLEVGSFLITHDADSAWPGLIRVQRPKPSDVDPDYDR